SRENPSRKFPRLTTANRPAVRRHSCRFLGESPRSLLDYRSCLWEVPGSPHLLANGNRDPGEDRCPDSRNQGVEPSHPPDTPNRTSVRGLAGYSIGILGRYFGGRFPSCYDIFPPRCSHTTPSQTT